MFRTNKYNNSHRFKSPNACPICGNEVSVRDLFCEKCGMRMHNHRLSDRRGEINRLNRTNSISADMPPSATSAYGPTKLSEIPELKAIMDNCKMPGNDYLQELAHETNNFLMDVYGFANDIIEEFERYGNNFIEERDFGLDKCVEAAKKIFNPVIVFNWYKFSPEQKKTIAEIYAVQVAKAFELKCYMGIRYEDVDNEYVFGWNSGDGIIHLANPLFAKCSFPSEEASPFSIVDTITHELRHQYQFEAIQGYHNVADDVRKEWQIAAQIYPPNTAVNSAPNCYDPWNYRYNPMEIDARYAAETVVRNVTHDWVNAKCCKVEKSIDRQALKKRLVQEGYPEYVLDKTTDNLLKLKGKAVEMLSSWLNDGIKPEFDDIEGVNSRILRERLKMKEPAIILSYGMLMNNPVVNSKYLKILL